MPPSAAANSRASSTSDKLYGGTWGIEDQFDIVRATFTDGTNVPRIPPVRVGGGVFWRDANWLTRINLLHAFAQNDIAVIGETPTAGYNLLKAELSYKTKLDPARFGAREMTGRPGRQQSAEREHPQLGVVHQGRGADAGHRRAGVCEFEVLAHTERRARDHALSRAHGLRTYRSGRHGAGNTGERAVDQFATSSRL